MLEFNAHDWKVAKKSVEIPLDETIQFVQIRVSCIENVTLYGLFGKTKVPLQNGPQYRCRAKVQNFEALRLEVKSDIEFGYTFDQLPRQDGEPIDHENPPALEMPGATNMVAQIQSMIRAEAKRNRLPVGEPEDLPGSGRYDIEEDDYEFEEELIERRKADLVSKQKTEPKTGGTLEPGEPGDPPPAPEAPAQDPEQQQPKHAAE